MEVGVDADADGEEGAHLRGDGGEIGAVHLAADGFGMGPGQQEADAVGAAERAQGCRGLLGVGDGREGQSAVLLQLGLAGDVVSAQDHLAAEPVGEAAVVDRERGGGLLVEPERAGRGRGGGGGAPGGQGRGHEDEQTDQTRTHHRHAHHRS